MDMCGVVKSPAIEQSLTSEHGGTIELTDAGVGFVILPADFPDPNFSSRQKGATAHGVQPLFQIVYALTPVGCAMPNLHVLREVSRLKSASEFYAIMEPSNNHSNQAHKSSSVQNGYVKGATSGGHGDGSTSSKRAGHSASGVPTAPGNDEITPVHKQTKLDKNRSESPEEWWKYVRMNEATGDVVTSGTGKSAGIPRSSSTGSLPTSASASNAYMPRPHSHSVLLTSERTVHNDRLIDGPLPLMESYRRRFGSGRPRTGSEGQLPSSSLTRNAQTVPSGGRSDTDTDINTSGNNADHSSVPQNTHEEREDNSNVTGRRKARPLCFFVAGGAPRGRVSWVVKTVPLSSTNQVKEQNMYHDWRSIS